MLRDDTLHPTERASESQNPGQKQAGGRMNGHDPLRGCPLVDPFQGSQDLARVSLRTEGRSHQAQGSRTSHWSDKACIFSLSLASTYRRARRDLECGARGTSGRGVQLLGGVLRIAAEQPTPPKDWLPRRRC